MDDIEAAIAFKALGDPTRLRMFNFLRSCSKPVAVGEQGEVRPVDGPTVGEVCCSVTGSEKVTSTVSFHLKELRNAGLITTERRGKNLICGVNEPMVRRLVGYMANATQECCEEKEN